MPNLCWQCHGLEQRPWLHRIHDAEDPGRTLQSSALRLKNNDMRYAILCIEDSEFGTFANVEAIYSTSGIIRQGRFKGDIPRRGWIWNIQDLQDARVCVHRDYEEM